MAGKENISRFVACILVIIMVSAIAQPTQVAQAATITVTSTSGGTGGPDCTLRDAITAADTDTATGGCPAGSGADTIVLASGATYTLTEVDNSSYGHNGLPAIHSQITIEGNESTVERSSAEGTPKFRIFFVASDGDLTMNDLTIRNGYADVFFWDGFGGGGAGIYIFGTMDATNITVIDNYSEDGGGGGGGIAVDNYGVLTLVNSTVSGNSGLGGGGVRVYRFSTATLINSTISENTTLGDTAGGIMISYASELTLINCTVSSNYNGVGSGIWNSSSSTTMLINSTVSHNSPSPSYLSGITNFGELTMQNSIVANQLSGIDCYGGEPVTSLGYNLDSDGTCNLTAAGDLSGVDPLLGPLSDNGGPTWTQPLLPGSPAIDAVPTDNCTVGTDQRGVPRPQGDNCDIGAYEAFQGAIEIDITPKRTDNDIDISSSGKIPVVIFSTPDFLVPGRINPTTLTFGHSGNENSLIWVRDHTKPACAAYDHNSDGLLDLVCQFETAETGFVCGDTTGILKGEIPDLGGRILTGQSWINVIPCD